MTEHKKILTVSEVVWRWKDPDKRTGFDESEARKKKSIIEASIALTAGLVLLLVFKKKTIATTVLTVGTLVLISGQFVPPIYYGFKKLVSFIVRIVGVGLNWILLLPFFYICFSAGRLFLLIVGKDPLHRNFDKHMKSYWVEHSLPKDKKRYEKQY